MSRFSSLRVRMVGTVFIAVLPALIWLANANLAWLWGGFVIGLFSLGAAWLGGELFILRQVKSISRAAKGLAAGNLATRTGMPAESTELGDLARSLDTMAETLQRQIQERERTEKALLNHAHQQTVVAALGQFALVASDLGSLLNQAVTLMVQTLEVEFGEVLEVQSKGGWRLCAGAGWKTGCPNQWPKDEIESPANHALRSGEPAVVVNYATEKRFQREPRLVEHGIASSMTVLIQGHQQPFGLLTAHSTTPREFTGEEVHFLLSLATILAMAVEHQRTESEMQKRAAFAKFNPNPVLEFSREGELTYFNAAAQKMAASLDMEHPRAALPPDAPEIVRNCLVTGENKLRLETRPGTRILSWSFYPITASQVVHCYVEDTTDRMSLEEQLRQSQKMESVGQLAAGVAHDFNNILTVIQGHSGLLMSRPNLSPAMTASIQAVSFASERAASLTRQLLMFSRKQVMQTRPLNLNELVGNMSKMLQRMIGETIALRCSAGPYLPPTKADASMIEQILMNLAVNARDAMPKGGELFISTEHVEVGEAHTQIHAGSRAGDFVRLQVEDTGQGMDAATMKRIFEPFFTTKGEGKGTGLGLATVYGIVRQHSGWIEVSSQLGKGTVFNIFFPAEARPVEEDTEEEFATSHIRPGAGETILVVEDEDVLRELALLILQDCGYNVLHAGSGVEALTVWQKHSKSIDLLLTDMIMPNGLSGKDLAESLLGHNPELKVIFTSGYNVEDLGATRNGSHFLQKPYSRSTLANAVRECLDA